MFVNVHLIFIWETKIVNNTNSPPFTENGRFEVKIGHLCDSSKSNELNSSYFKTMLNFDQKLDFFKCYNCDFMSKLVPSND